MNKRWRKWIIIFLAAGGVASFTGEIQAGPTNGGGNNNLEAALQATMALHPAVKSKLADLASLGFKVEAAEASRLPSIGLATQSMSGTNDNGLVRVQQPLWSFGKIKGRVAVAERRTEVGRMELLLARRHLMEETASAYISHWGLKQRLAIAETNVVEHDRLYQMILRRQRGGIASEADERMALSRLLQARAQRDQLAGAVEKARYYLSSLTQTLISADQPVDPALLQLPAIDKLLPAALDSEATIKLRKAELEVVQKEAALAEADRMPSIYARYERDLDQTSGTTTSPNRMGIVLEGSLDGMGIIGSKLVKSERSRIAAAQGIVEDSRNAVRQRVSSLYTDRSTQQLVGASYEFSAVELESTLKSFLRQYDAGRKSWVDVLNAQRELSEMRQMLEQAKTNWVDASLRLAAINGQLDGVAGVKP